MELEFRIANPADVPQMVALVNSAYRGGTSKQGWTTEADLLDGQRTDADSLKQLLSQKQNYLLLASQGGQLSGLCHLEADGEICWFGMFSIKPDLQAKGLGKQLLRYAEVFALNQLKCKTMQMAVIGLRAELLAFYQRRGYQETGEFKEFPRDEQKFGIPKVSLENLKMKVLSKNL